MKFIKKILHKIIGHWWIAGIDIPNPVDWKQECILCHKVRFVH